MSKLKEGLIKAHLESPIKSGDYVIVNRKDLGGYKDTDVTCSVKSIDGDTLTLDDGECVHKIDKSKVKGKSIVDIGVYPFPESTWHDEMSECAMTLHSVYSTMKMKEEYKGKEIRGFNFNPYLIDKDGNKVYYQRDLCWTLEDKQNFIESIYKELNCGMIVLRYNNDRRMLETGYDFDVVDGKQRLHTLCEFFNDEFPDKNGNYYSDFSKLAIRHLNLNRSLTFYMLRENVSDEKVKQVFLNVNFTGVPMSKEHLDYVKSINL